MTDLRSRLVLGMLMLTAVGIALPSLVPQRQPTNAREDAGEGTTAARRPRASAPVRLEHGAARSAPLDGAAASRPADRGALRRTLLAFLEPDAITARMTTLAPRAARAPDVAAVAEAYRQAFIAANPHGDVELRASVDLDQLAQALALLEAVVPAEERGALEDELVRWTTELAQILDRLSQSADDLSARGEDALAAARPQLAAQLAAQHEQLARVLRATGKPVPDTLLPLDQELTPEALDRIVLELQRGASAPRR